MQISNSLDFTCTAPCVSAELMEREREREREREKESVIKARHSGGARSGLAFAGMQSGFYWPTNAGRLAKQEFSERALRRITKRQES